MQLAYFVLQHDWTGKFVYVYVDQASCDKVVKVYMVNTGVLWLFTKKTQYFRNIYGLKMARIYVWWSNYRRGVIEFYVWAYL